MAEETIYCPSCNHKVRVPEELLGQPVQCPLCGLIFVTPTRGPAGPQPPVVLPAPPQMPEQGFRAPVFPPGILPSPEVPEEDIRSLVRGPATLLLMVGVVGWLMNAYRAYEIKSLGVDGVAREVAQLHDAFPFVFPVEPIGSPEFFYNTQLGLSLIFLFICTGILIGAGQMLRLRHYRMAVLASVLAMFNFQSCCCLLGLPIGIWSLSVLLRPEVRRVFG
jgi:hypothetical protein